MQQKVNCAEQSNRKLFTNKQDFKIYELINLSIKRKTSKFLK